VQLADETLYTSKKDGCGRLKVFESEYAALSTRKFQSRLCLSNGYEAVSDACCAPSDNGGAANSDRSCHSSGIQRRLRGKLILKSARSTGYEAWMLCVNVRHPRPIERSSRPALHSYS
jgi:hypothetical protein